LLTQFSAHQLRHLAALKEGDAPGLRRRRHLDREALDELATMLLAGDRPTIGWWRRHPDVDSAERGARIAALVELGLVEGSMACLWDAPAVEEAS
jgi:hypothetical protein